MRSLRPRPASRRRSTLLVAALTCGVLATSAAPTAAVWGDDLPVRTARTAHVPMFGVHTDHDPYSGNVREVDKLQRRLQRPIDIVNWYQSWGEGWAQDVHPEIIDPVTGSGRIPLLTWEPWDIDNGTAWQPQFRVRRIARGHFDGLIRRWANSLRKVGSRIYLRPMHEMNGNWYPWGGTVNNNSTKDYRAAWRRMHRIFQRRGADNVKFVWSPLNDDVPAIPSNRMERYYPGDRYVDVLALDGYNWGAGGWGGWHSFRDLFESAYKRIAKIGPQPIWIAETATSNDGGDKARWVRNMWRTAAGWRRLKAIVWFDLDKERDWRADTTTRVARAFQKRP